MFAFRQEEEAAPVHQENILPPSLYNRMQLLGEFPREVLDLIFNTGYVVGIDPQTNAEIRAPLFGHSPDPTQHNGWKYKPYEIQEIVRVYDLMKGKYIATGAQNDPVANDFIPSSDRPIISNDEAIEAFKFHLQGLVADREKKLRKGLLLTIDDTAFEAPSLAEQRRLELIKINLSSRKKIPIKGIICPSCKHDECFQQASWERSGDEPEVWYTICSKCDRKWRA